MHQVCHELKRPCRAIIISPTSGFSSLICFLPKKQSRKEHTYLLPDGAPYAADHCGWLILGTPRIINGTLLSVCISLMSRAMRHQITILSEPVLYSVITTLTTWFSYTTLDKTHVKSSGHARRLKLYSFLEPYTREPTKSCYSIGTLVLLNLIFFSSYPP